MQQNRVLLGPTWPFFFLFFLLPDSWLPQAWAYERPPGPLKPGLHEQSLTVGGRERSYVLNVPPLDSPAMVCRSSSYCMAAVGMPTMR